MTTQTEALKLALEALEYASLRIEKVDFDFEPEINAIKEALAQPEQEPHARDAITWTPETGYVFAQPEQEPVAIVDANDEGYWAEILPDRSVKVGQHLYAEAPQRKPLTDWIDPNDKTQERFLPNIGEPVLFCHEGKTYYGKHNGGSFQHRGVFQQQYFRTWECRWMPLPCAHNIKENT